MFEKYAKNKALREASYLFQVREYAGGLWLTYSDCLVCPCTMLKDPPVEAIKTMRELFVKRKNEKNEKR